MMNLKLKFKMKFKIGKGKGIGMQLKWKKFIPAMEIDKVKGRFEKTIDGKYHQAHRMKELYSKKIGLRSHTLRKLMEELIFGN